MSEPEGLEPWMRDALLADELDVGPSDAQRRRMAQRIAAAAGIPLVTLLPPGGGGGGGSGGGGGDGAAGGGGPSGGTATTAAAAGGKAALAIGALVAGVVIGVSGSVLLRSDRVEPGIAPASIDARDLSPDASSDAAFDALGPDAPPLAALHRGALRDAGVPTTAPIDAAAAPAADALARERLLIEVARAALRRGDLRLAAKNLVEHELRYPSGALIEERQVLSIELAVARGDRATAHRQAEAFRRNFPASVFRTRVDELDP